MISLVRTLSLALAALVILAATPVAAPLAHAQTSEQEAPAPAEPIAVESSNDGAIEARINAIFDEISALSGVEASVSEGVVSLSGMVANQTDIDRAVSIASRFQGVVTVEQSIERDLSVDRSISPTIANLENSDPWSQRRRD